MVEKRNPSFLGIGVQKGGSSWTWKQLKVHPQVGVPRSGNKTIKEMHFFDKIRFTLNEYISKFGKLDTPKVGEYTPNYICCPYAPIMIKTLFPDTQLFTIFRNPIDRAFSHYKDHLYRGWIPKKVSFIQAFEEDWPQRTSSHYSIKSKGMYGNQLELWHEHFSEEQIKTLFYDDLTENPVKFIQGLYKWLGLKHNFVPPKYDKRVVKGYNRAYDSMKFKKTDRASVSRFYREQIDKLQDLTGRKLHWQ